MSQLFDRRDRLVKSLTAGSKFMAAVDANNDLSADFFALSEYLKSCGEKELSAIFSRTAGRTTRKQESSEASQFELSKIVRMSEAEARQSIDSEKTPRKVLVAIGEHRFGISGLGKNKKLTLKELRDRLIAHLENEQTHQIIRDIASK
jgi:hypothetical protein